MPVVKNPGSIISQRQGDQKGRQEPYGLLLTETVQVVAIFLK